MKNELNHIDKLYNESLANYSVKASAYAWTRMKWRLLWINYGKEILITSVILSLLTITYFGIFTTTSDQASHDTINELSSSSTPVDQGRSTIQNENNENQIPSMVISDLDQNEDIFEGDKSELNEKEIKIGNEPVAEKEQLIGDSGNEGVLFVANENQSSLSGNVFLSGLDPVEDNIQISVATNQEMVEQGENFQDTKTPIEVDKKNNWLSIGFYISPDYNFHKISAETAYDDYLNYRKNNEYNSVSWSMGANLRFNIKNWYIETGLTYTSYQQGRNYNYTFKALDSLASYYQTDTIWGWVFDPPDLGEPFVLGYDTTFVPVYNETNEGVNVWRYLEIPLLAGYKFNKGRFVFDIGAGLSYGIYLNSSGNVPSLNEENSFDDLASLNQSSNIFNYILRIGFSYHLTPNWSLNVSPYYKQNLNSVFDNNYPVDQRFYTIGINFGLRVDL